MKNIKRFYSVIAVLLCIVLSIPTIARAEDVFEFTTYECIEDNYTEGTWQDMNLSLAYSCCNARYDVYANYLDSIPVSFNEFDYYCVYVSGSTLNVLVFDTDQYGFIVQCNGTGSSFCVSPGVHFETLTSNYNSVLEKVNGGKSGGCSMRIYAPSVYSKWSVNCASDGNEWTQNVNGDYLEVSTKNDMCEYILLTDSSIVNTNMDLFSGYEYDNLNYVRPSTPEDTPQQPKNIYNCTHTERMTAIEEMTILNIGVKYYDGENILGGAPNYDLTLGFDSFIVEKINHPEVFGGTGALVTYSLKPDTLKNIDSNWKMELTFEVSFCLVSTSDGLLSDRVEFEKGVFTDVIQLDISTIVQNGKYIYDLNSAYEKGLIRAFDINMLFEYVSSSDTKHDIDNGFAGRALSTFTGGLFSSESDYYFEYIDLNVKGQLVNSVNNTISNSGGGHVELVTGRNSSWVNQVSDDGAGEIVDEDSIVSGSNFTDVVIETDSNGNVYYNYYYYDMSNNTVTPSIGNNSNELTLYFANPLTLNGVGGGSSSSSSSSDGDNIEVVIEDDDYTDNALREDLKDGFGLLDNNETEELDDGFVQVASAFFESIDSDAAQVLMFGISSVVTISVLRAVFKR